MKVFMVEKGTTPIDDNFDVLVSELPLAYLQGIRDAQGVDAILIGSSGAEIQMKKTEAPYYTDYKTIDDALKGLEYEL